MRCKMCLEERKLVKAHIIPRSFYKPMISGARPPELASTSPRFYRKRVREGIYDKTIVCAECEDRFKDWDNYAPRLLLSKSTPRNYLTDERGRQIAFTVQAYDYRLLKLFFMSLLWRVSVSSHYFFSQVKIGPHQEVIRNLILNEDTGSEEIFSAFLLQWEDPLAEHFLLYPHRQRFENVNYIQCYLNSYIVEIKVDKRPTPDFYKHFMLKPDEPLKVILRELKSSHEYQVMQEIARTKVRR